MTDSNNYLRQLSALEEEETSSVSSSNLDRVDSNNLSKQLDEIENNTTFLNDATPDNTPATAVDEIAVTDVPEIDESPEAFYIRTGKVPVGYKYVPSVPVSDDPNYPANVKLVLDFDQPTVEEQTDKLFGYEDKKEIDKLLSEKDIIDAQDFVDKAPTVGTYL